MYTSYMGEKSLKLYNEREGTNLNAEEFTTKFYILCFSTMKSVL